MVTAVEMLPEMVRMKLLSPVADASSSCATADHVAVKPAVVCNQIGKITLAPMKAKYAKETHSVPIRKLRRPKKCKSMTGYRSVSSQGIRNARLMSATIELVMMA